MKERRRMYFNRLSPCSALFQFFCIILVLAEFCVVSASESCESLYKTTNDVWLFGEAPEAAPFAAQLHAIFSYAPTAFVFQTGLVASDLIIHEPVRENEALIDWKISKAPFSSFFDLNHYTWYWSQHRLKVISSRFYHNCFEFNPLGRTSRFIHERSNISRIPEFFPYSKDDFKNLIYYANTTSNETFQFPFLPHRQVKIDGRWKFVAFYSFWSDLPMLQYVYTSLKPSMPIEKFSKALLSLIPAGFIAVHMRVDDDAFAQIDAASSRTESDSRVIKKIIQYIKDCKCLKQHFQQNTVLGELGESEGGGKSGANKADPPAIYLLTNQRPTSKNEKRRTKKIIEELLNSGFSTVLTRKILYDKHMKKRTVAMEAVDGIEITPEDVGASTSASPSSDLAIMKTLNPEQLSYVDMIVGRSSRCFVSSYAPSLASYLIKRYMKFDQNIFENYADINQQTYGNVYFYRDWGL